MGYTGTTNYGFQKPAKENAFTVNDLNNALDKIDETIKIEKDDIQTSLNEAEKRIPTSDGEENQVWTSNGSGSGVWKKINESLVIVTPNVTESDEINFNEEIEVNISLAEMTFSKLSYGRPTSYCEGTQMIPVTVDCISPVLGLNNDDGKLVLTKSFSKTFQIPVYSYHYEGGETKPMYQFRGIAPDYITPLKNALVGKKVFQLSECTMSKFEFDFQLLPIFDNDLEFNGTSNGSFRVSVIIENGIITDVPRNAHGVKPGYSNFVINTVSNSSINVDTAKPSITKFKIHNDNGSVDFLTSSASVTISGNVESTNVIIGANNKVGQKVIYTGSVSDLYHYDSTAHTITINQDFEVYAVGASQKINEAYHVFTFKKGTYNPRDYIFEIHKTLDNSSNTNTFVIVNFGANGFQVGWDNSPHNSTSIPTNRRFTKVNTEEFDFTDEDVGLYAIYVFE